MELGEERGPRLIVCNQMAKYLRYRKVIKLRDPRLHF